MTQKPIGKVLGLEVRLLCHTIIHDPFMQERYMRAKQLMGLKHLKYSLRVYGQLLI